MAVENSTQTNAKATKVNGQDSSKGKQPRTISHPRDVANLVMMQIDAVNSKKDELTIAVKGLADTAKQLTRAYAQQAGAIAKLQKRVQELESKEKGK